MVFLICKTSRYKKNQLAISRKKCGKCHRKCKREQFPEVEKQIPIAIIAAYEQIDVIILNFGLIIFSLIV